MKQRKGLTAAIIAAVTLQSFASSAFACGSENPRVVKSPSEFRASALFALAVETSPKADQELDLEGRPLKFIGNAFLIEKTDDVPFATAYFATARHNIAAACRATVAGQSPKLRLVMRTRASYGVQELSAATCDELRAIEAVAGGQDVIFVPDVTIIRAQLPFRVGTPVMVGSQAAAIGAGNGNVEQMSSKFLPVSTPAVGLPDTPWQKPEHQKFVNVLAIGGNNLGGASGSPYVVFDNGQPIVLGILTNSIPPVGVAMHGDDFTLTAAETAQLFAAQFPEIAAQAFSLVFKPETLVEVYNTENLDQKVSKPFVLAQTTHSFSDHGIADNIAVRLNSTGLSGAVYLKRQCEKRPDTLSKRASLALFCTTLIDLTEDYQCYIDSNSYSKHVAPWLKDNEAHGEQVFAKLGEAIKTVNDAREVFGRAERADTAEEIARLVSNILRTAHTASDEPLSQIGSKWESAVLFDLAKAERVSGLGDDAYLSRLSEAIEADPSNLHAKKAFVDGTAQAGAVEKSEKSLQILGELQAVRAIPKLEAERTRNILKKLKL